MQSIQEGVLAQSDYYLSAPKPQEKRLLYYPVAVGEYWCHRPYRVDRKNYNSFLLMLVEEGDCYLHYRGTDYGASAGDVIFISCYEPHCYGTLSDLHLQFLHFDGAMSEAFYREVTAQSGVVYHDRGEQVRELLWNLLLHYRKQKYMTPQEISLEIEKLLLGFLPFVSEKEYSEGIKAACAFAKNHYHKPITVHDMAVEANCSESHFSRQFKKETGNSPYEYILNTRMEQARKLLKTTELSMRAIAVVTGFGNEINLINGFHKKEGMTPGEFRRMPV